MRMTVFSALFAILITSVGGTPTLAFEELAAKTVLAKAVDGYMRPAYQKLSLATESLVTTTRALCADPSSQGLKQVEERFGAVVKAWSRAELVRMGPILEKNRLERILFFPDRKSTGLKQIEALLAARDESVTTSSRLADKSVAVQGLGAFEFVFFGSSPDSVTAEKNSQRCRYGLAIADNLNRMAAELAVDWDKPYGIGTQIIEPGSKESEFRDHREAVTALLGIFVHGVELWREQRLELFYRAAEDKGRPKQAIYWRTGNTFAALTASLEGLKDLWTVSNMSSLLDKDSRSIAGSILFDIDILIKTSRTMEQPTQRALADPKYRAKLDFLALTSRDLLLRLNDDYGKAIGLGAGFSFSDGD